MKEKYDADDKEISSLKDQLENSRLQFSVLKNKEKLSNWMIEELTKVACDLQR